MPLFDGVNLNITNYTTTPGKLDIIDKKGVQVLFFVVYTTIFIVGLFGNVLVCFVVFRNKAMQTVTNLFITNLALSDILLCVLAVPFTPLYTLLGKWIFGSVICHLVPYAQGASVYISTLTLMSIAIDRYFVIIYPFHPRMKLSTCVIIIIIIWVFAIVVTSPYGIYMKHMKDSENNGRYYCEENWPVEQWRAAFGAITTALQFLIPFLIMAYCYICVSIKLNDRARSKPGSKNSRKEEADRERKRRTNRMLIAMVAVFLLSWLPLNVVNIFNDFNKDMIKWEYYFLSFFLGNNETQQETLLPSQIHRSSSIKEKKLTPLQLKNDNVEMENIMIMNPAVEYDPALEVVRLNLITEEDPPPYNETHKTTPSSE
ncbi:unnamed protein product [Ceutorhynchus assimilis]|uniref:Prolactin-releasing peptide receptor n=1 Tax=Ceutorhynchus assimilis TaxID=467358 RepID=A0A9P0DEM2_9CUCU|nr:unnamed protein product [Ceutorhynchus assimilis]